MSLPEDPATPWDAAGIKAGDTVRFLNSYNAHCDYKVMSTGQWYLRIEYPGGHANDVHFRISAGQAVSLGLVKVGN